MACFHSRTGRTSGVSAHLAPVLLYQQFTGKRADTVRGQHVHVLLGRCLLPCDDSLSLPLLRPAAAGPPGRLVPKADR